MGKNCRRIRLVRRDRLMINDLKRVSLIMGHYGSGKTNVAVNLAIEIKKNTEKAVTIYDLDIVNPYFRTLNAKNALEDNGVETIASQYANSNVDLPALNAKDYMIIDENSGYAVVDVGGDDRGALALGRFYEKIIAENDYDAFFVINKFRPETNSLDGVLEIKEQIETAAKLKFSAIINNSNLGVLTDESLVLSSLDFAREVSNASGLPIKYNAVVRPLVDKLVGKVENILPIDIIDYKNY